MLTPAIRATCASPWGYSGKGLPPPVKRAIIGIVVRRSTAGAGHFGRILSSFRGGSPELFVTFLREGHETQAVSGEIHPVRPFQPKPVAGDTHVFDEIGRILQRGKDFPLCDHRAEVNGSRDAIGPDNGDRVVRVRDRLVDA